MKRTYFILLSVLFLLTAESCTKGFDELYTDPNRVQDALPRNLLSPTLYDIVATDVKQAYNVGNELMQYTIYRANTAYVQRYDIRATTGDNMWGSLYAVANNIADMEEKASNLKFPNYIAIALTLKALVFSRLTDTYGNIPYTEALQSRGETVNFLPKFNRQEDIYAGLLADLERAAMLFDKNENMQDKGDLLYQGDVTKWRKFCNSLRLRLYLRVGNRPEIQSAVKINEIVSNPSVYPIFTANSDDAYLPFSGVEPYYNPYWQTTNGSFSNNKAASTYIVNILQGFSDPRISAWYTKNVNDWTGAPAGFPYGMKDDIGRTSYLRSALKSSPRLGMMMSYAELQFILAEAALKGWITGDAKTYYENGVKASMSFWGVTMPSGYLTQIGVVYDNQLSTIMLQKYLSLFFVGQEAWYEYRRTGYPVLTVHQDASNNGKMPRRLLYPTTTQKYNKTNYDEAVSWIGQDNINIRCWWENP